MEKARPAGEPRPDLSVGAVACAVVVLCLVSPVRAITSTQPFGSTPNGTLAGGSYSPVGAVRFDDGAVCSGSLISPTHVLTAGHCFSGPGKQTVSGSVSFELTDPIDPNMTRIDSYAFDRARVHEDFVPSNLLPNDIAVIKLTDSVTGIEPLDLLKSGDVGIAVSLVGWGTTNDGTDGLKRFGRNEIDAAISIDGQSPGAPSNLVVDFDGDRTDVGTGSGDSGGPAIVGGQVLGVLSASTGASEADVYGDKLFYTRVSAFEPWISSVISNPSIGGIGGDWTIRRETFSPGAGSRDRLELDTTINTSSRFDIELSLPTSHGVAELTFDSTIINGSRELFGDFQMQLGSGLSEDFRLSGGEDQGYFSSSPMPQATAGGYSSPEFNDRQFPTTVRWDATQEFGSQDTVSFLVSFAVDDSIDGVEDGFAKFTIRQAFEPILSDGDFDGDGDVDSFDREILVKNWTGALLPGVGEKTKSDGDSDGDNDVDGADLTSLVSNWSGASSGRAWNLLDQDAVDVTYDLATADLDNLGNVFPGSVGSGGVGSNQDIAQFLAAVEFSSELGAASEFASPVVPEPAGSTLAFISLAILLYRRRR